MQLHAGYTDIGTVPEACIRYLKQAIPCESAVVVESDSTQNDAMTQTSLDVGVVNVVVTSDLDLQFHTTAGKVNFRRTHAYITDADMPTVLIGNSFRN